MEKFDLDDIQFVDNTPAEAAEAKRQIAAELARLQAIEAAARETVNTARSLAGSLTPDMPYVIREKILKLAAAVVQP